MGLLRGAFCSDVAYDPRSFLFDLYACHRESLYQPRDEASINDCLNLLCSLSSDVPDGSARVLLSHGAALWATDQPQKAWQCTAVDDMLRCVVAVR